jgi:protein TonB
VIAASSRISPVALATSAVMHAALAASLLSALPRMPVHLRPQAMEITVDLVAAEPAKAARSPPDLAMELPAPPPPATAAPAAFGSPPPDPAAPEIATQTMAPLAPPAPPGPRAQQAATARTVPPPRPAPERILPSVKAPPAPSARDFDGSGPRTAPPPAAAKAPRPQAPVPKPHLPRAAAATAGHAAGSSSTLTESDGGHRLAREDYLWQVIRKLSQYKVRAVARDSSEQGLVVLRLTLERDGRLIGLALARSSGFPDLDRGVIDAARAASPFAPLPPGIADARTTLVVPIRYVRDR